MMLERNRILLLTALAAVPFVGCSGDSMTGPSGTQSTNLSGSWTYAAPNMTGSLGGGATVTCSFSNVPMSVSQSGGTFTGSTNGGSFVCSAGGVSDGGTLRSRILVNGEVAGADVEFDFDGPDWHHSGRISGNSMTGQATAIFELSSGSVVLRGSWSAAR